MKKLLFVGFILGVTGAIAGNKKGHHHHKAHVHGTATLDLAFDQLKGRIEFKSPAEGVLGFEHMPKSDQDKKKLNDTITTFEKKIAAMIKFEEALNCIFTKEKIEMAEEETEMTEKKDHHDEKHEGEHSDFIALFNVDCKKSPQGSKIKFDFSQFKGLRNIDVTILLDDLQKSVQVQKKPITLDLN